jgi:hypothetical protein
MLLCVELERGADDGAVESDDIECGILFLERILPCGGLELGT